MTRRPRFRFLLIGFAVFWVPPGYAECECPPDSLVQAISNADRVFQGRIVSAQLSEDDTDTIEFVVEVVDPVRGSLDTEYRLTTQRPGSCGVSVRLGFHDMFVLSPVSSAVSRCGGSGRAANMARPLLALAIELVDLPELDARGAQALLRKGLYSNFSREILDEFFDLVEKIDPRGDVPTRLDDRIEYRGIILFFVDGKYERVEVRQ